jgi:hypothetical protein
MKLKDFLPDIQNSNNNLVQVNQFLSKIKSEGFQGSNILKSDTSGGGLSSEVQKFGIEQLYFDWLRTAYAYRRQFIQDLYLLAFDSAEIRTPLLHLKNEVFRKGFDDWKPKFILKCLNPKCGKEFQEEIDKCDKCGSSDFRKPDEEQYKRFDDLKLACNSFSQGLEELLRTTEDDVNIVDDLYIHLNKEYEISPTDAKKVLSRVVEVRRIHPALIEYDLDKNGIPKNSHWMCQLHRDEIQVAGGKCPICLKDNGRFKDLTPAMYVYNHRGKKIFLYESELIHSSKFSPSETYGYSPLLTIMQKILTVSGMDRFLYRYFFERKAPTGMILTYTDDPQSLEGERARIEAKMMEDPTYMPWIAVSSKTGRGRTDFIRLFHTLQEMDYLPVRNEIRDRISAIYGVPQMYMNVMEGIGGISGQTQQLKVFSNVIQSDQRLFNEKIFIILLEAFGITDWKIQLRPPEEKVEGMTLQLASQKVLIAQQMLQMGFEVKMKSGSKDFDTIDFTFSGKAANLNQMQPGAGGGMPPGTPGADPFLPQGDPNATGTPNGGPAWERKDPQEEGAFNNNADIEDVEDDDDDDQEDKVYEE